MRLGQIWRFISLLDLLFLIFDRIHVGLDICIRSSSPIHVDAVDAARLPKLDIRTLNLYLQHTMTFYQIHIVTYLTSLSRLINLGSGVSFDLPTAS